jgi:hypothetical protein
LNRIFIGSHSLPPLWFAISVLQIIMYLRELYVHLDLRELHFDLDLRVDVVVMFYVLVMDITYL